MTTHQLAAFLDNVRIGLATALTKPAAGEFNELVSVFRELPDQSLKELVKSLRKATASPPGKAANAAGTTVAATIERIQQIQRGSVPVTDGVTLTNLGSSELKDVLRAFQKPVSGNKAALVGRIQQLATPIEQVGPEPPVHTPDRNSEAGGAVAVDQQSVDEGVQLYARLRDDKSLSLAEVRSAFERFRELSKPVIEAIAARLNHPTHGTRTDVLDRLWDSLEGIKMSQFRSEQILTGT